MFESLGFETLSAPQVSLFFALIVGIAFGGLAEQTKFCFRGAVIGHDRRQAAGLWALALAVSVTAVQGAVYFEIITFEDHRFLTPEVPLMAAAVGGLLFGIGMVLSRGCASRLTVLSGTGNMRALFTLILFGLAASATLKGPLSGARTALATQTIDLGDASTVATLLPFGLWSVAVIVAALVIYALSSGNRVAHLVIAVAIGLLPAIAWVGTGYVLYDDFDPIAFESIAFTLPAADSLFWIIASTSVTAKFTVGLMAGVIVGAFVSALISRRLAWVGFDGPAQMGRYGLAAILMGFGGVVAGGCTIGAGLSGIPTLSVAAITTLAFIAIGAKVAERILNLIPSSREFGGSYTTLPQQPAE